MSIPIKELKALLQKSGNRCAFPNCGEALLLEGANADDPVILSKIAHIVAEGYDGPRGRYPLPLEERNKESNLLLLCGKHHDIIDNMPQLYTVERLRQMKEDHEALIRAATGDAISRHDQSERPSYIHETVFSTLFQVVELPLYVYAAPCDDEEAQQDEIRTRIVHPKDETEIYPYIIRGKELYTFQNLNYRGGPFQNLVNLEAVQRFPVREWWDDPVKSTWFTNLLNRALNKLTGRKGLQWDREHQRYYFQPDEPGKPKEVSYRPLNRAVETKKVVWQPVSKRTGEPRPYWLHRAVNLRFHRVSSAQWCFSIRPEFRVTKDSVVPEASEKVGSRVTRKKSHMFNYDLLGEVNFWRDFLSDSQPRIIFNFGKSQHAIISTTMIQTEINWPGIPEKFARPFKNIDYAEDLFSWAKLVGLEADLDHEFDEEEEQVGEREEDYSDE
jgi:hypothetical protein